MSLDILAFKEVVYFVTLTLKQVQGKGLDSSRSLP